MVFHPGTKKSKVLVVQILAHFLPPQVSEKITSWISSKVKLINDFNFAVQKFFHMKWVLELFVKLKCQIG